jgi:geranylgeranyl reductase family protein
MKTYYDIAVVGAGPGGASTAYYASEAGLSTILCDKARFPRRKICGDAVTRRAQHHLERMGVLDSILESGEGRWSAVGGLVSPSGISYIGDSKEQLGSSLVISVKREILDARIVGAAAAKGAELEEGFKVTDAVFDPAAGRWRIISDDGAEVSATVLVAADGASSLLARSLGLVERRAEAVCSSVYIKGGTHDFDCDGIVYYPDFLLPGYAALFREADDDLVFCTYIIPGGRAKPEDLKELHHRILTEYEPVASAVGPKAEIEEMKAAPLRLGGEKRTYGDHVLVVGDAAGHIDPLTGEGIQYALDAGQIAAQVLRRCFDTKDFSEKRLERYQREWIKSFGRDFAWSARMAAVSARRPVFLDAFASLSNRKGDRFMSRWGMIMTGSKPKSRFFLPGLSLPLAAETVRLKMRRKK